MNAQEKWKREYRIYKTLPEVCLLKSDIEAIEESVDTMRRWLREAALERKLEAAQRRIDRLEKTIRESVLLPRGY